MVPAKLPLSMSSGMCSWLFVLRWVVDPVLVCLFVWRIEKDFKVSETLMRIDGFPSSWW